jgi:DMSO/TMAO reductase YedYZ molybdopterin-dependent catalytic subunit
MRFKFFSLIVLVSLALAACAAPTATPAPTAVPPSPAPTQASPAGGDVVLTLTGAKDTKTFTLDAILKLPPTEGQGGMKSSTGKIEAPALYKGVLLTDLLAQVGGMDQTQSVQVEAKDGYAMTYSPDQVLNGNFVAYDPGTGDETKSAGKLQVLIAYAADGKPLDDTVGPLRLVVISDKNNQVVDGHWATKWVNKITVKALAQDWVLHLEGALKEDVDRGSFESCTAAKCHQAQITDTKSQQWTGVPLYLLVGRVDDQIKHDGPAFNDALADAGYTVDVVGADGYTVTFDSARLKRNKNIIVADQMNGNPLTDKVFPLKLVGTDLTGKESVGAIAKIVVHLNQAPAATATAAPTVPPPTDTPAPTAASSTSASAATFTITGLVGKEQAWSLDDLKKLSPVTVNLDVPKQGKQDVTGVPLSALLALVQPNAGAKTATFSASDGYSTDMDLSAVAACKDCLVAFDNAGGLYSAMPGMPGKGWVKNLVKIEIK